MSDLEFAAKAYSISIERKSAPDPIKKADRNALSAYSLLPSSWIKRDRQSMQGTHIVNAQIGVIDIAAKQVIHPTLDVRPAPPDWLQDSPIAHRIEDEIGCRSPHIAIFTISTILIGPNDGGQNHNTADAVLPLLASSSSRKACNLGSPG